MVLQLAAEWTPLKSGLVLLSVLARCLQVPLLVFAAWSMRSEELRLQRWRKPGIAVALLAGALSFVASFMYRDQPAISLSLRSLPFTLGLVAASLFYAVSFFQRWPWPRTSSATILAGSSSLLYALDQTLYIAGYIRVFIAGPGGLQSQSVYLPLLVHPGVLLLDLISSGGICLGMLLVLMEQHHRSESDLREIASRSRQIAESNAALLAEISERKRMEQALRENEDRYRDLVEHSEDLLCTHDLKGRLLSVNPAPARVLGYEVEELLQMSMRELLVPRFRDKFDTYMSRIQRKGEAFGLMGVLTRAGKERIWEYHNTLRTEGVPAPIVRGMAHDVTEKIQAERHLRQSEAKFAIAFRSNPSAMMISSLAEGQFIDVNNAFESQTGYVRDEVVGRTAMQLGMWMDTRKWESVMSDLQNGNGVKNLEMRLCTKKNPVLTVSYSAEIIELAGNPCMLAVSEDITSRKHTEERLRNLSAHLVHVQEEERARIARELHDDVNQRLAVIGMELVELKSTSFDSKAARIQKIQQVSKLVFDISTDVRKVSHRLHPALLEFLGLAKALSEFCSEFGRLNEMEIQFVHSQVPPALPKDVTLCLYRVTQEAVRNAQKHSGCRHVQVELTGAPDCIRLRVSDSGAGFDPSFAQSNRLGLISMAERVRSLGGELSVQSRPSYGTSVEARIGLTASPDLEWKGSNQVSATSG